LPNRPVYAAIGVSVDGHLDLLGLWMGVGGEGAKVWMSVLVDLKNCGIRDVFFLVCDGLQGLPDAVTNVGPHTIVQTCIVHLIRNTFRLAARQNGDAIKRDIKPIYTAPSPDAALAALDDLEEKWGKKYSAMVGLWRNAWEEFVPFLDYDVEIRGDDLLDERDRITERPLPAGVPCARTFPNRAGRDEVPVSSGSQPGPDRDRPFAPAVPQ
jgi:putative transposase